MDTTKSQVKPQLNLGKVNQLSLFHFFHFFTWPNDWELEFIHELDTAHKRYITRRVTVFMLKRFCCIFQLHYNWNFYVNPVGTFQRHFNSNDPRSLVSKMEDNESKGKVKFKTKWKIKQQPTTRVDQCLWENSDGYSVLCVSPRVEVAWQHKRSKTGSAWNICSDCHAATPATL